MDILLCATSHHLFLFFSCRSLTMNKTSHSVYFDKAPCCNHLKDRIFIVSPFPRSCSEQEGISMWCSAVHRFTHSFIHTLELLALYSAESEWIPQISMDTHWNRNKISSRYLCYIMPKISTYSTYILSNV